MNKEYMSTKLELDKMKTSTVQSTDNSSSTQQKQDLGSHLFKFSSKVKAFQSNINTKLATAGLQINNLNKQSQQQQHNDDANTSVDEHVEHNGSDQSQQTKMNGSNDTNKETRRLKDDIETL